MRLTDQEKQDIFRYVETDKPLTDKYRFLLFNDKRRARLKYSSDNCTCLMNLADFSGNATMTVVEVKV